MYLIALVAIFPLENLASYVKQLKSDIQRLSEEITDMRRKGRGSKSAIVWRKELVKVTRERDMYLRDAMAMAISIPEEEDDTNDEVW